MVPISLHESPQSSIHSANVFYSVVALAYILRALRSIHSFISFLTILKINIITLLCSWAVIRRSRLSISPIFVILRPHATSGIPVALEYQAVDTVMGGVGMAAFRPDIDRQRIEYTFTNVILTVVVCDVRYRFEVNLVRL